MKTILSAMAGAAVLVLVAGLGSQPTDAAIACQGPNQVMKGGGLLQTPYCQDEYLARVARSRGMRVSGRAIRKNINLKISVCRFIGFDNRIRSICDPYVHSPGRGRNKLH